MKRITVVLAITAVLAALATPAMAGKPEKPPKTPEHSYYTLEVTSDGLSATCGEVIVRRNDVHFEWFYEPPPEDETEPEPVLPPDIALRLAAPGLAWNAEPLAGCRNAGVVETYLLNGDVETSPAGGYFRITLEDDGTVAMLWIFDIYERYAEVQQNKKRTSLERITRTDFRMGGPYEVDEQGNPTEEFAVGQWSTGTDGVISGTVAGAFTFVHFDGGDFTLLTNPVHHFGIDFTLTPYVPST